MASSRASVRSGGDAGRVSVMSTASLATVATQMSLKDEWGRPISQNNVWTEQHEKVTEMGFLKDCGFLIHEKTSWLLQEGAARRKGLETLEEEALWASYPQLCHIQPHTGPDQVGELTARTHKVAP